MACWKSVAIVLCLYGLSKEFKPTEPYLYRYQHTFLNISDGVLNSQVYPLWTYSYLLFSIPAMLLTDLLLYKPVLLLESVSYILVWLTLIFGRSVLSQQLGQILYGMATATEVAYFAYIYVKVDRTAYKRVTAWTRAALQLGKCGSYLLAQLVLLFSFGDYQTLNWISLISLLFTFVFALLLPFVHWRDLVEHERNWKSENNELEESERTEIRAKPLLTYKQFAASKLSNFWTQIIGTFSANTQILKWSLWWAMATCGDLMVGNYIQLLWGEVQADLASSKIYNGFVEGTIPLLSALTIMGVQKWHFDWCRWGESVLFLTALTECLVLLQMSQSANLYWMYAGYAVVRILYQMSITVAQFNLAYRINVSNSGLLFGLNMFCALLLQSLVTFLLVDFSGPVVLKIRSQFIVYGLYHGLISAIFFVSQICRICPIRKYHNSTV